MALYGGIYGMSQSDIQQRISELLTKLQFADHKDDLVGSLPLGWKQKLAFMVATIHRPELVFLDEPTGGVDPITRRQFWDLIRATAAEGTTIFVTTHYMDEAEFCNRITMMVDGVIRALDTPANLRHRFHADTMEQVFYLLAREAKRGD
jgi:ABC-2 type transport system ATP-binding protein